MAQDMDIDKVNSNSLAKKNRNSRPISAFIDLFNATNAATVIIMKI
jgi:hypothetical protein